MINGLSEDMAVLPRLASRRAHTATSMFTAVGT